VTLTIIYLKGSAGLDGHGRNGASNGLISSLTPPYCVYGINRSSRGDIALCIIQVFTFSVACPPPMKTPSAGT